MPNANETQVGGTHYSKGGEYQHWDMTIDYGNRYLEGVISSYVTRWRDKGGIGDLEKAAHTLDKLLESVDSAMVGPPQITIAQRSIDRFMRYAVAYNLDNDQIIIIYTVHTWSSTNELQVARYRLKDYITRQLELIESSGAGAAYVAQ